MARNQGLLVIFLGPDGSGKSTVIGGVKRSLAAEFDDIIIRHLFPSAGETENQPPVTHPHAISPRRVLDSFPKMALWVWRFSVGYIRHVRPNRARSRLILFDRYFPDIIVDPRRYRYGGPAWLAKLMWRILPKPDLVILLDAPTEMLQARKKEVPPPETERQRHAYLMLVQGMTNGHVVDASQPVETVITSVTNIILDFMVTRTRRRTELGVPQ